jgi:hypothetical protein
VLILHGEGHLADMPFLDQRIVEAYAAKYDDPGDLEFLPGHPSMSQTLLFQIQPSRAVAWELASAQDWVNRRWQAGEE